MANPRQRRKAKGKSTAVKQSRRQKQSLKKKKGVTVLTTKCSKEANKLYLEAMRGPSELLQTWDRQKTVNQNYAVLGLVPSLKVNASGGTEAQESKPLPVQLQPKETVNNVEATLSLQSNSKPAQHGRIIRDEDGNIISIELPVESEVDPESTPWGRPFEAESSISNIQAKTTLAQSLENLSKEGIRKTRHSSNGEITTLRTLVAVHGKDLEAMSHDHRRNIMQRTTGQIKAAIRRAGGFDVLRDAAS